MWNRFPITIILIAIYVALAGCASTGPPLPPSLEIPKPPSDLRATRKADRVTLSWTVPSQTTDRQSVRYLGPTRICRTVGTTMTQCDNPVGEVAAPDAAILKAQASGKKVAQEYVDTLPASLMQENPTTLTTYAVEVYNRDNHGAGISNQVTVPLSPTLPAPTDFRATVSADGVVLTWLGPPPDLILPRLAYRYRVYRTDAGKDIMAAEAPLDAPGPFRYVDHGFEWEKSYQYRVAPVTLTSRFQPCPESSPAGSDCMTTVEVEGADSPIVEVNAHDVFPPTVPGGLEAVFSGPGQPPAVDLIWAPAVESDLAGYNIYRREATQSPAKLNPEPVKTPAYHDPNIVPGRSYFYSVTSVDLRGNESAHSEETSEQVPQP